MDNEFLWRSLEIAVPIVGAVVVWALGMLGRWLQSKTSNERLDLLIEMVRDAAATAVSSTQQTLVDGIKKGRADGALTADEKKAALDAAMGSLKNSLGAKGVAAVQAAIGFGQSELEAYLKTHLEAAVADKKGCSK